MRINLQSDYALRILMFLAVNKSELPSINDVSAHYGISKNHLMKVTHLLNKAGLVGSVRGRAGGIFLEKPEAEISVGEVIRLIEADFALVECFDGGKGTCFIAPECRLKGVLSEALGAFLQVLDRYSIKDLIQENAGLKKLLELA
jgi:Rrf2 family nitric oxide-sensitive transcriptional repressor